MGGGGAEGDSVQIASRQVQNHTSYLNEIITCKLVKLNYVFNKVAENEMCYILHYFPEPIELFHAPTSAPRQV